MLPWSTRATALLKRRDVAYVGVGADSANTCPHSEQHLLLHRHRVCLCASKEDDGVVLACLQARHPGTVGGAINRSLVLHFVLSSGSRAGMLNNVCGLSRIFFIPSSYSPMLPARRQGSCADGNGCNASLSRLPAGKGDLL
jgi:hypothetical protein